MTIASAFNDIAVAQGGAASKTGSIAGAIDALNDALAGSDQAGAETIEDAVRLLGDHIGGGGGDVPEGWYFVNEDINTHLDKTWNEINTMYDNGSNWVIVLPHLEDVSPQFVDDVGNEGDDYYVVTIEIVNHDNTHAFVTDSANGYPTLYTP